jgi:lipopolysaccharide/colanic/teichoic acid biosynthesis glycosyltransferase
MMKRLFDISFSLSLIIILSPFLSAICLIIFFNDKASPFYVSNRVGRNFKIFKMIKLRSMIINADKSKVDSTSSNDKRITKIGHFIRRFKLDELPQLINVLKGDMSFVGPRPNVEREVNLYSSVEKGLLKKRPGITDLASIIFSDEGEILKDTLDPDLSYNQLIRPWKSRLGIIYINQSNFLLDIKIILLTMVSLFDKKRSTRIINKFLVDKKYDDNLIEACKRNTELKPYPPPGFNNIITKRF